MLFDDESSKVVNVFVVAVVMFNVVTPAPTSVNKPVSAAVNDEFNVVNVVLSVN